MITFRSASIEESDILSDLAIKSKGHWGYSKQQLDNWRSDLRVGQNYIQEHIVRTIWSDSELVGFFAIKTGRVNALDHLWLLPEAIGKGIGVQAFKEVIKECEASGIDAFTIVSDPNAEGFYLKEGAKRIGEVESTPKNRLLPKLRYKLNQTETEQVAPLNPDKPGS